MIKDLRVVVQLSTANFCPPQREWGDCMYRVTKFLTIKDKFKKCLRLQRKEYVSYKTKQNSWHQLISHSIEER